MTTSAERRKERIEHLLDELRYELTRGLMEHEIDEEMNWRYVTPICRSIPNGVVTMAFVMRPAPAYAVPTSWGFAPARPRVIGQNDPP